MCDGLLITKVEVTYFVAGAPGTLEVSGQREEMCYFFFTQVFFFFSSLHVWVARRKSIKLHPAIRGNRASIIMRIEELSKRSKIPSSFRFRKLFIIMVIVTQIRHL